MKLSMGTLCFMVGSSICMEQSTPKINLEKSIAGLTQTFIARMQEIDNQEFTGDFKTDEQKRYDLFKIEEAKFQKHLHLLKKSFSITDDKIKKRRRASEIPHSKTSPSLTAIKE